MQVTKNNDGSTKYSLPTGNTLVLQQYPDVDENSQAGSIVKAALDRLNALAEKTFLVNNDSRYSTFGRQDALAEIQATTMSAIAMHYGQVQTLQQMIDSKRAAHLAIPALGPTLGLWYFEEAELREWWRNRASNDDKAKVFAQAATDPQCARVLAALLHDPVPSALSPQSKAVADAWASVRDAAEPGVAEAIEGEQRAADWAFDSIALIAAIALQLVTKYGSRNSEELLKVILASDDKRVSGNALIYGYSNKDVEKAKRSMAVEALRAKERASAA